MVRVFAALAVSISLSIGLAASPSRSFAAKDQARIGEDPESAPKKSAPLGPHNMFEDPPNMEPIPDGGEDPGQVVPFELLESEDIPVIKTIELTVDIAKRAIDALSEVRDKYNDQGIDEYDTLEEFVSATDAGKRLEADVRRFGFEDITDWNTSITSVGFAYGAVKDGEEEEILQQISEIKADAEIEADAKTQMIASLQAMIASTNNKSIVRQLMQDEYYAAKLKLLDATE